MAFTQITKGNFNGSGGATSLDTKNPALQPNYSVEFDGYGLITGRATFTCTASSAPFKTPKRGDVFPGREKRLYCHLASYQINGNNLATVTAEYVGIENGIATKLNVVGDIGTSTEPIKTHPNFKTVDGQGEGLQAKGWDITKQDFIEGSDADVDSTGDSFKLTGTKSFLRPSVQITGILYTSDKSLVKQYLASVGRTFTSLEGADFTTFTGIFKADSKYHTEPALVTGASYEEYGILYKIKIAVRIAPGGWHKLIYKSASTQKSK
jgi:hypothetical protein